MSTPPAASPKDERDAFARAHADERRQVKRVDQAEWARIENAAKAGWDAALQSSLVRGMAEGLETYMKWARKEGTLDSERGDRAREALAAYKAATAGGERES